MKRETKGRKWSIVVSVLSIICCVSLIAGATFALFTDRQENEVTFSSGKMDLSGTIDLESTWYVMSENGTPQKTPAGGTQADFEGGGTVSVSGEGEDFAVAINGIAPGEGADFALTVTNLGNIKAKFAVYLQSDNGFDLAALAVENLDTQTPAAMQGGRLAVTENFAEVEGGAAKTVNFSIGLPYGYEGDVLAGTFFIVIEGYQYNASTEVTIDDEPVNSLQEALEQAAAGEKTDYVIEAGVGTHTLSEAPKLNGKNITILGNGETNTVIEGDLALNGGSLALENATLSGDITGSGTLSMANVNMNGSVDITGETTRQISLFSARTNTAAAEVSFENVSFNGTVAVSDANVRFENCTLTATVEADGSAILIDGGSLTLAGNAFSMQNAGEDIEGHAPVLLRVNNAAFTAESGSYSAKGGLAVWLKNATASIHGGTFAAENTRFGTVQANGTKLEIEGGSFDLTTLNPGIAPTAIALDNYEDTSSTLIIRNAEIESTSYGIGLWGTSELQFIDGTITSTYPAIANNGLNTGTVKISVEGGAITAKEDAAFYLPSRSELTITGGTVTGAAILDIRMGTANISISGNTRLVSTLETWTPLTFAQTNGATRADGSAFILNTNRYTDKATDTAGELNFTLGDEVVVEAASGRIATVYDWNQFDEGQEQKLTLDFGAYENSPAIAYYDYDVASAQHTQLTVRADGKFYASLADAASAAEIELIAANAESETVTLAGTHNVSVWEGVTYRAAFTVAAGANVTVGGSGGTIRGEGTHTFTNSGNLTINGGVTVDNITHQKAAVVNYAGGVFTLNGGSLTRSLAAGTYEPYAPNGNSFYALVNNGTANLNSGSISMKDGYSSLIQNVGTAAQDAEMIISGGTYSGGVNTVKNDDWGVMTIENGSFENYAQHCVLNAHNLTIDGGTFTGEETATFAICTGKWYYTKDGSVDESFDGSAGTTVINGGTFNGGFYTTDTVEYSNGYYDAAGAVWIINDGTFAEGIYGVAYTPEQTQAFLSAGIDVQLPRALTITSGKYEIDLNGRTVTAAGDAIHVDGAETVLTIRDGVGTGRVIAGSGNVYNAVWITNLATVNIYGGYYFVGVDGQNRGNATIYVGEGNGYCNIHGGTFETEAPDNDFWFVLNIGQTQDAEGYINVCGGTFVNYNPAEGDDNLGGSFVEEGYTVQTEEADGKTYYTVVSQT